MVEDSTATDAIVSVIGKGQSFGIHDFELDLLFKSLRSRLCSGQFDRSG
jgi:hypothetical protein